MQTRPSAKNILSNVEFDKCDKDCVFMYMSCFLGVLMACVYQCRLYVNFNI